MNGVHGSHEAAAARWFLRSVTRAIPCLPGRTLRTTCFVSRHLEGALRMPFSVRLLSKLLHGAIRWRWKSVRACLKIERGPAAADFAGGQGGEARASPQRAARAEPTRATGNLWKKGGPPVLTGDALRNWSLNFSCRLFSDASVDLGDSSLLGNWIVTQNSRLGLARFRKAIPWWHDRPKSVINQGA